MLNLTPDFDAPAPRALCTDCGLSRTSMAGDCGRACQFIAPDYPAQERRVHGRTRDPGRGDEKFFGPYVSMHRARLRAPAPGAQWTGITTRLAQRLLETGAVDAVLTVAPDPQDRWKPVPVLVTDPADMAQVRGMRMGYAPLLALSEFESVYVKLSGFYGFVAQGWRYPQAELFCVVDRLKAAFGVKRLLWGSDFSPVLEHNTFRQAIEVVRSAYGGFAPDELDSVLHANAERIIAERKAHGV